MDARAKAPYEAKAAKDKKRYEQAAASLTFQSDTAGEKARSKLPNDNMGMGSTSWPRAEEEILLFPRITSEPSPPRLRRRQNKCRYCSIKQSACKWRLIHTLHGNLTKSLILLMSENFKCFVLGCIVEFETSNAPK